MKSLASLQWSVIFFKVRNILERSYIKATHRVILTPEDASVTDEIEASSETGEGLQAISECLNPTGAPINKHLWPFDLHRLRYFDAIPVDSSRTAPCLANDSFKALDAPLIINIDANFYETAIQTSSALVKANLQVQSP